MTLRPCMVCGEPTGRPRCAEHTPTRDRATAEVRGYDTAWRNLSRRARKLQPFCSSCGSTESLSVDHSEEAWQRKAAGKVIRLQDVTVLCGPCNTRRGSSRPTGDDRRKSSATPAGEAKFGSLFGGPGPQDDNEARCRCDHAGHGGDQDADGTESRATVGWLGSFGGSAPWAGFYGGSDPWVAGIQQDDRQEHSSQDEQQEPCSEDAQTLSSTRRDVCVHAGPPESGRKFKKSSSATLLLETP